MIYEVQKGTLKKRINIQELEFKRNFKRGGEEEMGPVQRCRGKRREVSMVTAKASRPQQLPVIHQKVHLLTKT